MLQKLKRALVSQAVADAFCYEFEFYKPTREQVALSYDYGDHIRISDDTQMTMFGVDALLDVPDGVTNTRRIVNGYALPAYVDWYCTQTSTHQGVSWLARVPGMKLRMAPGNTCLSSLRQHYVGQTYQANNSKGDGAVMRSLPFIFAHDILGLCTSGARLAIAAGQLTHNHTDSSKAVSAFVHVGEFLAFGRGTPKAGRGTFEKAAILVSKILGVDVQQFDSVDAVHQWDNTFTAIPCMVAAFGAFYRAARLQPAGGFREMMIDCCVNNGDSDTIAAIAGALWGLLYNPPVELVTRLAESAIIDALFERPRGPAHVFQGIQPQTPA